MSKLIRKVIQTDEYQKWIDITAEIEQIVAEEKLQDAFLTVQTLHTTAGITVNEGLPCLEQDLQEFLDRLVPEDHPYFHARMLPAYGSTAGNAPGHLRAFLCGNHCHLTVTDGKLIKGGAQNIYFCEFDGPARRTYIVMIQNLN